MATAALPRLLLFLAWGFVPPAQAHRHGFPDVADVSRDRPVTSSPAAAVCGLPTSDSYCRSTATAESVRQCLLASCNGHCPRRSATPAYLDLLVAVRPGACVVPDYVNTAGAGSEHSVLVLRSVAELDATTCYVTPPVMPVIAADGSFSLTVWLWLESNSAGCVCVRVRHRHGRIIIIIIIITVTTTMFMVLSS